MNKYIFILGNNPALSVAEIKAVFPDLKSIKIGDDFAVFEGQDLALPEAQNRLGGTIKVGVVIGERLDEETVMDEILAQKGHSGKVKFGFSWHGVGPDKKTGLKIKKLLKAKNIASRYVESKEKKLSSVIVKKEKCLDFLVLPGFLGLTQTVQDFMEYGRRDFGRPASDSLSGMLPPKLAKIMINLSGATSSDVILDPFCGSGTILSEAAALGFTNLIGCDVSKKAVEDTAENLSWLNKKLKIENCKLKIFQGDVKDLSQKIKSRSIDIIITEPYLGPALRGGESEAVILKIKKELEGLYLAAFQEFKKVLKPGGRVVMVFPEWPAGNRVYQTDVFGAIGGLGFTRPDAGDLVYKREKQKVWRRIAIFKF